MRLADLASVSSWLPDHPLAADRLWQREPGAVSEGEIQLFYARASLAGLHSQAVNAIDMLQAAVILSSFNAELPEAPGAIIMHEPPPESFFADELVEGLVKMRPSRRQACLFALEQGADPAAIANMTWTTARSMRQLRPLCQEILQAADRTRHVKLPYVFWEWATTQIATPLLELQWSIEQAFGCTWPILTTRYRRMVKLSRGADAVSVLELIDR